MRCHKLAKEFAEMYSVTGLVGVHTDSGMPCIQIRVDTFYDLFSDGNYAYDHHANGDVTISTINDGVKYCAYINHMTKVKDGKVED